MAWGKTAAEHCLRLHSYPQAQRYFEQRKRVRSNRWKDDERPLISSTETWYKLVRGGAEDYYDLVCWDKPVVRYFKPLENGDCRVLVRAGVYRQEQYFLFYQGFIRGFETLDGRTVRVPLSYRVNTEFKSVPKDWSASLWFNKENKLIVDRSEHRDLAVPVSSAEDKERRKNFRKYLRRYIELIALRIPEYHANCQISKQCTWIFSGANDMDPLAVSEARNALRISEDQLQMGEDVTEEVLQAWIDYGQVFYNVLISREVSKLWREKHSSGYWPTSVAGVSYAGTSYSTSLTNMPSEYRPDPIPMDMFNKKLVEAMVHLGNQKKQTGMEPVEHFPEKMPKRYIWL